VSGGLCLDSVLDKSLCGLNANAQQQLRQQIIVNSSL
jgi:hypothetical protein